MVLFDLDELNKINLDDIPNLRVIVNLLYHLYSKMLKRPLLKYMEFAADDFDTITSLLKLNLNQKIVSLNNEVFNNDFILDDLEEQINYLKSRPNIKFLENNDLIKPDNASIFNDVSLLYLGPYEPEEQNIRISKLLLKSIPEFTPICFYPADEMKMDEAEETINWLENRWIGLFKKRVFVFEKMRLDNQLDILGFSIQPNCIPNGIFLKLQSLVEKNNYKKSKIINETPHYKSENLMNIGEWSEILNEILGLSKIRECINSLKNIFSINNLVLSRMELLTANSNEMKIDIKENEIKKIINSNNNFNQNNKSFKIFIPLQDGEKYGLNYKNNELKIIKNPEKSIIIGSENFNYRFPNLNKNKENNIISFVVLFLETNLQ